MRTLAAAKATVLPFTHAIVSQLNAKYILNHLKSTSLRYFPFQNAFFHMNPEV